MSAVVAVAEVVQPGCCCSRCLPPAVLLLILSPMSLMSLMMNLTNPNLIYPNPNLIQTTWENVVGGVEGFGVVFIYIVVYERTREASAAFLIRYSN